MKPTKHTKAGTKFAKVNPYKLRSIRVFRVPFFFACFVKTTLCASWLKKKKPQRTKVAQFQPCIFMRQDHPAKEKETIKPTLTKCVQANQDCAD